MTTMEDLHTRQREDDHIVGLCIIEIDLMLTHFFWSSLHSLICIRRRYAIKSGRTDRRRCRSIFEKKKKKKDTVLYRVQRDSQNHLRNQKSARNEEMIGYTYYMQIP